MYFRKNMDFSPTEDDFQIGEIDIGIKIGDAIYGGAGRIGDSSNQLHLEFEDEKEIEDFISFLRVFETEAYFTRIGYYEKPLLKRIHQHLKKYKIN